MENPGLITLLPFIVGIFFLIWQEDVIFPLIGGLFIGSIIVSRFNLFFGFINTAGDFIVNALTKNTNIFSVILIAECLLFFSILNRTGFINTVKKKLSRKNLSRNRLEYIVVLSNLALFIDRNLSTLLVGIFSRPFARDKKLAPVKHAYLLNTVPSAISTLIPFSTIIPIIIVSIGAAFTSVGIGYSPLKAYYRSLPYQYYNIFSFFIVVSTMFLNKDIFFMKSYNRNHKGSSPSVKTQNNISFGLNLNIKRQSNTNIALYGMTGSLLLVFATIIIGFVLNRHGYYDLSIRNIQNHQIIFISSLFTGIIFSILYAIITKAESYTQFKTKRNNISFSLLITLFYIFLAMAIEYMAQKLNFSEALINVLRHRTISAALIPMLIFIFSSIISFLSGSFLFTITGVLPFAIRIISLNMTDPLIVDNLLFAVIGSVLSGATFGDMNSPFSLNFIISTAASEAAVSKHFISQIIYSLIAFSVSIIFGYLLLLFNIKPYLSISSGLLVISLMFIFIDRNQHSITFKLRKQ